MQKILVFLLLVEIISLSLQNSPQIYIDIFFIPWNIVNWSTHRMIKKFRYGRITGNLIVRYFREKIRYWYNSKWFSKGKTITFNYQQMFYGQKLPCPGIPITWKITKTDFFALLDKNISKSWHDIAILQPDSDSASTNTSKMTILVSVWSFLSFFTALCKLSPFQTRCTMGWYG